MHQFNYRSKAHQCIVKLYALRLTCVIQGANQTIQLASGGAFTEANPFTFCPISTTNTDAEVCVFLSHAGGRCDLLQLLSHFGVCCHVSTIYSILAYLYPNHSINIIARAQVSVLATVNGLPLVLSAKYGAGSILLFAASFPISSIVVGHCAPVTNSVHSLYWP